MQQAGRMAQLSSAGAFPYAAGMAWSLDMRIPLTFCTAANLVDGVATALLVEAPPGPLPVGAVAQVSFQPGPAHTPACSCCGGRSDAAAALDRLFQVRVRAQCGWFDRVLVIVETAEATADVAAALREDAVTAARFRLVPGSGSARPGWPATD
jgi:hypothetical protein